MKWCLRFAGLFCTIMSGQLNNYFKIAYLIFLCWIALKNSLLNLVTLVSRSKIILGFELVESATGESLFIFSFDVLFYFQAELFCSNSRQAWGIETGGRSFRMEKLNFRISIFSFLLFNFMAFNISHKFKNSILFIWLLTWRLADSINLKRKFAIFRC